MFAIRRFTKVIAPQTCHQLRFAPAARSMATFYLPSHEYITIDGEVATVGITDFAQNSLGDIVYVEMPEVDDAFEAEESFGSVESVKAASDIYMPMAGTVMDINEELEGNPGLVNEAAETEGWLVKIKLSDPDATADLLDEAAYKAVCDAEAH